MEQSHLLKLAKQGEPSAIAALMNAVLIPKGITAQVYVTEHDLEIRLESAKGLNSEALVTFLQKGLSALDIQTIRQVNAQAYKTGVTAPVWTREFVLSFPASPSPEPAQLTTPSTPSQPTSSQPTSSQTAPSQSQQRPPRDHPRQRSQQRISPPAPASSQAAPNEPIVPLQKSDRPADAQPASNPQVLKYGQTAPGNPVNLDPFADPDFIEPSVSVSVPTLNPDLPASPQQDRLSRPQEQQPAARSVSPPAAASLKPQPTTKLDSDLERLKQRPLTTVPPHDSIEQKAIKQKAANATPLAEMSRPEAAIATVVDNNQSNHQSVTELEEAPSQPAPAFAWLSSLGCFGKTYFLPTLVVMVTAFFSGAGITLFSTARSQHRQKKATVPELRSPAADAKQQEAEKYLKAMTKAQEKFYQQNNRFAETLEELERSTRLIAQSYSYAYRLKVDDHTLITATPRESSLASYISAVFAGSSGTISTTCRTAKPSMEAPPPPELSLNPMKTKCPLQSVKVK